MNFLMYVYFIFVYFSCSLAVKPNLQILVSKVFKETILEQYFLIQVLLNLIKWKLGCK